MDIKIPTLADTIVSNKGRYYGAGVLLRCPASACVDGAAALLAVRLRYSVSSSVTKHLPRSPIAAHTAIALDSATGGGQSRGRCHSLRQSTSHNVTFSASGKFHLCLGFSSPHKAGFAGPPSSPPPAAPPSLPGLSPPVRVLQHKNMGYPVGVSHILVPVAGLEPARCRQRWILSPLRLPIPSHRQVCR